MGQDSIDFYFDIVSVFSYFGFEALLQYESQIPLKINFKPVSIGQVFKSAENKPPMLCPAKAKYVHTDLELLSEYWNVPYKHASNFAERVFKANSVKTQKFLMAVSLYQQNDLKRLMRGFWTRFFYHDKDIFSEQDIKEVCKELGIKNVDKLLEMSNSNEVKQKYMENTNEAIENGAFGLPWIVAKINGKTYKLFGTDRLHILFDKLKIPFKGALPRPKL